MTVSDQGAQSRAADSAHERSRARVVWRAARCGATRQHCCDQANEPPCQRFGNSRIHSAFSIDAQTLASNQLSPVRHGLVRSQNANAERDRWSG
jgi:hypothetical protein